MEFQWVDLEVLVLLLMYSSKGVLTFNGYNVAQSSKLSAQNGPQNAVDNNDNDTCAVTNSGVGNYWRKHFIQTLTVKSVRLRLKGGNYTIEVRNSTNENSDRFICASEHLPFPFALYIRNITCKPVVQGDIIIVNKADSGPLSLCDFKLKVCENSSQGIPCPMCTSDNSCRHCDQSHYGASCEHTCSPGCVPGSCDELNGECICTSGFTGRLCHFISS